MDKVRVIGGNRLQGTIPISGAKNAALPLMAACLLTEEPLILSNLPHLMDIATMANLLIQHGADMKLEGCAQDGGSAGQVVSLQAKTIKSVEAPYDIVRKMRASVLVLGPLLARCGQARVSLPGGCAIGTRPIDLHLKAFEQMGAVIELEGGYINAHVKGKLQGADITFEKVSVGATENLLMAASLAEGKTILRNAAQEPEIGDLAHCLVAMGAKITGIDTPTLEIDGVDHLHGAEYAVIADRIEAGTYMVAAAITGGDITLTGLRNDTVGSTIDVLRQAGARCDIVGANSVRVRAPEDGIIRPVNITTEPYPGFPTDMQAQLMALMTIAEGKSIIDETIFENRFMHVSELCRMGAHIAIEGHRATVTGTRELKAAQIMATDLRASVSLILAALAATGETVINRMYHIDRGYERIEEKLAAVGAEIVRFR